MTPNLNISYQVVKDMTYGDEVKIDDEYCLYHYSQDDLVVLYNDETKNVELEMC